MFTDAAFRNSSIFIERHVEMLQLLMGKESKNIGFLPYSFWLWEATKSRASEFIWATPLLPHPSSLLSSTFTFLHFLQKTHKTIVINLKKRLPECISITTGFCSPNQRRLADVVSACVVQTGPYYSSPGSPGLSSLLLLSFFSLSFSRSRRQSRGSPPPPPSGGVVVVSVGSSAPAAPRLPHRLRRGFIAASASQSLPPLPASEETGFAPHFSGSFAVPPTAGDG